jgi:hypothetical protein
MCEEATVSRIWKVGCAIALGGLILILSCGLSHVAVEQGFVMGPDVHLHVGSYRLVAYTTRRPLCPPYRGLKPSGIACSTDSVYAGDQEYVIWLLRPARWDRLEDRLEIPYRVVAVLLR